MASRESVAEVSSFCAYGLLDGIARVSRGGQLLLRLARRAAAPTENLLEFWAVRLQAHDAAAEGLVRVRISANTPRKPLGPGAILGNGNFVRLACRAAGPGLLRGLIRERRLALESAALHVSACIGDVRLAVPLEESGRGQKKEEDRLHRHAHKIKRL